MRTRVLNENKNYTRPTNYNKQKLLETNIMYTKIYPERARSIICEIDENVVIYLRWN